MRLMKSWRNSFLHHVSPLDLIFATTMEKQVMSDIHAAGCIFFFFSLLYFPSLSSLLVYMGDSKNGECLRADDVQFGRLIKGQRGAWEQRDKWCLFSKNKTGTPIAFLILAPEFSGQRKSPEMTS